MQATNPIYIEFVAIEIESNKNIVNDWFSITKMGKISKDSRKRYTERYGQKTSWKIKIYVSKKRS